MIYIIWRNILVNMILHLMNNMSLIGMMEQLYKAVFLCVKIGSRLPNSRKYIRHQCLAGSADIHPRHGCMDTLHLNFKGD